MDYQLKAVILAAGKGTRINADGTGVPKVMRRANGRPLLAYVLDALSFIGKDDTILVVGYKKEDILYSYSDYPYAVQDRQLGTGHAVSAARDLLRGYNGGVLVCCGDMPLLTRETYEALASEHAGARNACTILSGTSERPLPYGRVVRDAGGGFLKLVEEKDASPEELKIRELNAGVYIFDAPKLLAALSQLKNSNAQGEYYLTDIPEILHATGEKVGICARDLGSELIGVNTAEQLAEVEELLRTRQV